MPSPREGETMDELRVVLRRAARKIGDLAESRGSNALAARAMIDPDETIAVWRNGDNDITVGAILPEGIAESDVVLLDDNRDGVLTVSAEQLTAAGRNTIANPSELGPALEIEDWAEQDDKAAQVLAAAGEKEAASRERAASRLERTTTSILDRRETLVEDFRHSVEMAEQHDPAGQSYSTITAIDRGTRSYRRDGLRWQVDDDDRTTTYDTQRFTRESRERRQRDADITLGFLDQAIQAVRSMKSLERRAERSGIERAYSAEDLDRIEQELTIRRNTVAQTRNDRGR